MGYTDEDRRDEQARINDAPDLMRDLIAKGCYSPGGEVGDLLRAYEKIEAQRDRTLIEAQIWAQEARTHEHTVRESYQAISGGRGEPGTWNGARPVREYVEKAERLSEAARVLVQSVVAYKSSILGGTEIANVHIVPVDVLARFNAVLEEVGI